MRLFPAAVLCFVAAQALTALRHVDPSWTDWEDKRKHAQTLTPAILLFFMLPAFARGCKLVIKMTD